MCKSINIYLACPCEGVDEDAFGFVGKTFYVAFLFFFPIVCYCRLQSKYM